VRCPPARSNESIASTAMRLNFSWKCRQKSTLKALAQPVARSELFCLLLIIGYQWLEMVFFMMEIPLFLLRKTLSNRSISKMFFS
jgi:hypothetical protein